MGEKCQFCKKIVAVKKDGRFRVHRRGKIRCPGTDALSPTALKEFKESISKGDKI